MEKASRLLQLSVRKGRFPTSAASNRTRNQWRWLGPRSVILAAKVSWDLDTSRASANLHRNMHSAGFCVLLSRHAGRTVAISVVYLKFVEREPVYGSNPPKQRSGFPPHPRQDLLEPCCKGRFSNHGYGPADLCFNKYRGGGVFSLVTWFVCRQSQQNAFEDGTKM